MTVDELPIDMEAGQGRIYMDHKTEQGVDYIAVMTAAYGSHLRDFSEEEIYELHVGDVFQYDPDLAIIVEKIDKDEHQKIEIPGLADDSRLPGVIFITDEWFFRHNLSSDGDPNRWQLCNTKVNYIHYIKAFTGEAFWLPLSDNCNITKSDDSTSMLTITREELFNILDNTKNDIGRDYRVCEFSTMNNKVISIKLRMDEPAR